jgi:hypothetical protein
MVLLRALNYDFAGQPSSYFIAEAKAGNKTLSIANNGAFTTDDYVLIDPYTDIAEIVKISSTTLNTGLIFTTGLKFDHKVTSKLYKMPYNQIKYYSSSSATGTFTEIVSSTTDMDYRDIFTPFNASTTDTYFKRTFYNATTDVESDVGLSDYWQTNDEFLMITPQELRTLLQFGENDYPNEADMRTFIKTAQLQFALDCTSSNNSINFIGIFMLSKYYVLRALATKSVSKGYVTINAEGRQITKAYQELVLEAENTYEEYKSFLKNNLQSEATSTQPMAHSGTIDSELILTYKDMMTGVENATIMQRDIRNIAGYNRLAR